MTEHTLGDGFGPVLRSVRRAAGLTQERLALAAGIGLRTVQELERGKAHPRRETVRRLCAALELPIEPWLVYTASRRRPRVPAVPTAGSRVPPEPRTSLIGREREVELGRQRLREGRIVTLVGPGGVGKSRLAVELARAADAKRRYWVELAAGSETSPSAVLEGFLGIRRRHDEELADGLVSALGEQSVLVVLDGCEHCLGPCAELAAQLLDGCPRLRILCTSRTPVKLYGEALLRLAPLAVPASSDPAAVLASPAARLFLERAALVRNDELPLDEERARQVAEICRRLDGLPLSIELAAAASAVLPLDLLLERVQGGGALSLEGWRDSPERHGSLRRVIEWSYELLAPEEQVVFRRAAVFAGSFGVDAAEGICDLGAGDRTLPVLLRLVDASLVVRLDGADRFRLLDTVRDFGLELLRASGEEAALRQRHLAWYAAQSERAVEPLQGAGQERWLARLEADRENIWAAARWSAAEPRAGEPDRWDRVVLGQPLLSRVWRYWFASGFAGEAYALLRRLLDEMGDPPHREDVLRARAFALGGACVLAGHVGDAEAAVALGEESLALRHGLDDDVGVGNVMLALGIIRLTRGEHWLARPLLEQSREQAERLGDRQMAAFSSLNLARALAAHGERARAERCYADALAVFQEMRDSLGTAWALHGWGVLHRGTDLDASRRLLERSEQLFLRNGDRGWRAQALAELGRVRQLAGDLPAARALHEQSERLAAESGYREGAAGRARLHALLLWEQGEEEAAVDRWRTGIDAAVAAGDRALVAAHVSLAASWLLRFPLDGDAVLHAIALLAAAAALRRDAHSVRTREERRLERDAFAFAAALADRAGAAAAWRRGLALGAVEAANLARRLLTVYGGTGALRSFREAAQGRRPSA